MLIYIADMAKATAQALGQAAELFHALSDATRLCILTRLAEGEHCVCELTETFDIAQSKLSFHLKVLKEAGLITDRPEGRWIYYALKPAALDEVLDALASIKEVVGERRSSRRCS